MKKALGFATTIDRAHSLVGDRREGRPADDFYPTPPGAVGALLDCVSFTGPIWEPACGDGAISKFLEVRGYRVYSTDLNAHGYGRTGVDFLQTTELMAPTIITNPPFKLAEDFVFHAVTELKCGQLALLCKLAFLEGAARSKLLEETHLSRVLVFRRRLTLTRNGEPLRNGSMIAFAWFVWQRGYFGGPVVYWI